jgi:DNA-binding response OmpR family regulator
MGNENNKKSLIWVVDDDEAILEAINIMLVEAQYEIQTFPTGDLMKDALKQTKPSLILLDVILTKENGKDISKELKEDLTTKNIPLILMSANTRLADDVRECSANGYIKKPFDMDTLIKLVSEHT